MKCLTETKKIIIIIGYVLSAVMMVYFLYSISSTVGEISVFEKEIGRLSFEEKCGEVMSDFAALVQAFTLALITRLYSVIENNFKN